MESRRFDTLARHVALAGSRRGMLKKAAGAAAAAAGLASLDRGAAQEATQAPSGTNVEFLFVQTALTGTLSRNPSAGTPVANGTPIVGGGADLLLALAGHNGRTVYFSDRPERIVGDTPTGLFLEGLGFSPRNPPNAALVTGDRDAQQNVVVLELFTPGFDEASATLTYGASIQSEYPGGGLQHLAEQEPPEHPPESFESASLFLDDCADLTSCMALIGGSEFSVGPIPGGPYGTCWSWWPPACSPCNESEGDLEQLCNNEYSQCNDGCTVDF